jgi:hypothetical protein
VHPHRYGAADHVMPMAQPALEDLLAQWWRSSYPNANLNNQTAALMVAFTRWVLEQQQEGTANV